MTHNAIFDEPEIDVDDFLAHYGVKGMKWGVRRSESQLADASDDAKRASSHRSKAKASGSAALSNKEMQELVTRLNLQQQYTRLTSSPSKLALSQNKVKAVLAVGATVNTAIAFSHSPAGKALRDLMADGGGKHTVGVPVGSKTVVPSGPGKHRK